MSRVTGAVLNGRCKEAGRLGNKHADRFARSGAACHPLPEQSLELRSQLIEHRKELLRWGGMQDVLMAAG
eukprot:4637112-Pyramimonas_sp.AAC.1